MKPNTQASIISHINLIIVFGSLAASVLNIQSVHIQKKTKNKVVRSIIFTEKKKTTENISKRVVQLKRCEMLSTYLIFRCLILVSPGLSIDRSLCII